MAAVVLASGIGVSAAQEGLALPEEYLMVTGGWYLNVRCDFLDRPARLEFRDNLMQLDEIARSVLDGSYVKMLREAARQAAYEPTRGACGDDEKAVVLATVAMAQSFAAATTGKPQPALAADEPIPEI